MTPTKPGYYWFMAPDEEWEIVNVYERGSLYIRRFGKLLNICVDYQAGTWGEKIERGAE